jgi:hypothetical protein
MPGPSNPSAKRPHHDAGHRPTTALLFERKGGDITRCCTVRPEATLGFRRECGHPAGAQLLAPRLTFEAWQILALLAAKAADATRSTTKLAQARLP